MGKEKTDCLAQSSQCTTLREAKKIKRKIKNIYLYLKANIAMYKPHTDHESIGLLDSFSFNTNINITGSGTFDQQHLCLSVGSFVGFIEPFLRNKWNNWTYSLIISFPELRFFIHYIPVRKGKTTGCCRQIIFLHNLLQPLLAYIRWFCKNIKRNNNNFDYKNVND